MWPIPVSQLLLQQYVGPKVALPSGEQNSPVAMQQSGSPVGNWQAPLQQVVYWSTCPQVKPQMPPQPSLPQVFGAVSLAAPLFFR